MKIIYNNEITEMKHITVIKLIILKEWWNYRFGQNEDNEYFFNTEWYCDKLLEWHKTRLK